MQFEGFFQALEAEFFEQGGDGQQAAVGSQIQEVIGRGSPDGPRGGLGRAFGSYAVFEPFG